MKRIIVCLCCVFFTVAAYGQVELSNLQNGVFHLSAAGFVNEVITHGSGVSAGYRTAISIRDTIPGWLFIEAAQAGSINVEYPSEVYVNFASRFEYQYTVEVTEGNEAPTNCAPSGTSINCDAPTNEKTLTLFSWDGATFTDTEEVADVDGDFDGLSPGNYVVGYTGAEFCTTFLTVS